ncbi:MAG: acetylxylan esterase [Flavonifractor plautii]
MEQSGRIGLCWTASTLSVLPLLTCPLLLGTGLLDQTASPKCQYAIFNRARGPKTHLVYPKYGHERINFFENELLKFFHI